ncbi:MAG: hypothetical protein ACI9EF_002266 [Pseudohongiellaceae bacterium]|jgi:hypothetical protein
MGWTRTIAQSFPVRGTVPLKIELDVSQNLLEQFREIFGADALGAPSRLEMSPAVGVGRMERIAVPGQLELSHYWATLKQPLDITTTNSVDSEWYGLNINLANDALVRTVGTTEVTLQRHLPSGMLLYPPGSSVSGVSVPNQRIESVFLRFHREFLTGDFPADFEALHLSGGSVLYEAPTTSQSPCCEKSCRPRASGSPPTPRYSASWACSWPSSNTANRWGPPNS